MGWQDDPIVTPAKAPAVKAAAWQSDPVVTEAPSMLDNVGRQVGLTARAAVTGAASLPALGADAIGQILNLGIRAYNEKTGSNVPEFKEQMGVLEKNLSAAGLPEPSNPTERIVYDTNKAMAGQGAAFGAGKALSSSGNEVVRGIGKTLTTRPDIQLEAAAGSGASGSGAREGGFGPIGQFLASLTGGVLLPAGVSIARGAPALLQPFTEKGQRQIAGNILSDAATSPAQAKTALASSDEIVPGSRPTIAAATRDPGLASLERSLSAKPVGSSIQDRYLQNNDARMAEMNDLSGTPGMIEAAKDARDAATSATRENAFASAQVGAPSSAVIQNIDKTLKSPVGKREVVADALNWAKSRLQGVTDPRELYAVRQDITDAMKGKLAGDKSAFKLASGQLSDVVSMLDDVIESDAPGFKAYLQQFKDQSKPINQMEVMQEITRRSIGTAEDALGNRQLLPSGFQRSMDNLDEVSAAATGFKKARAEDILTDAQKQRLENLRSDLMGEAFAKSGGKVAGSNTVQLANYSTANIIGRIVSGSGDAGPLTRNIARSLDWLNKLNDRDIDRLLVEAAKDPALAGTLMKGATRERLENASDELDRIARSIGIATATSEAGQKRKTAKGSQQ